jgi:hypothetical protein
MLSGWAASLKQIATGDVGDFSRMTAGEREAFVYGNKKLLRRGSLGVFWDPHAPVDLTWS